MAGRFAISTVITAVDNVTRPMRRMTRNVLRGIKAMTRGFVRGTKAVARYSKEIAGAGLNFVKLSTVGAAGLTTAVTLLNRATVESQMLADAVGISADTLEALGEAVKPAGFQLDNIVDLVEEMNNKLGESAGLGQTTPVQEALAILGLQFRDLQKLNPEQQFKTISDAILNMGDSAQAVSAADILFGGEANKIFGVLRSTGQGIDDIVGSYQELNFQTDASRKGAARFTQQFNRLTTVVTTLFKFISGLVGDAMEPLIDGMVRWTSENRELIRSGVLNFIERFVAFVKRAFALFAQASKDNSLGGAFEQAVEAGKGIISFLVEYGPALKTAVGATVKALALIIKLVAQAVAGITTLFETIGTFLGETVAKMVIGVERLLESISSKIDRVTSGVRRVTDFVGLTESDASAPSPGVVTPAERTARILEERKVTNTTELTIRDDTRRAEFTSGGAGAGLTLLNTGAL